VISIHVGEEPVKACFWYSQAGPLESVLQLFLVYYTVVVAIDAPEELMQFSFGVSNKHAELFIALKSQLLEARGYDSDKWVLLTSVLN